MRDARKDSYRRLEKLITNLRLGCFGLEENARTFDIVNWLCMNVAFCLLALGAIGWSILLQRRSNAYVLFIRRIIIYMTFARFHQAEQARNLGYKYICDMNKSH